MAVMKWVYHLIKNLNTELNDQIGHYNITTFKGRRYSSSKAFLNPILKNQRLKLMTKTYVNKLIIKENKIEAIEVINKKRKLKLNLI